MQSSISPNEQKLFQEVIDVRKDNKHFQLLKTAEECNELTQAIMKVVNYVEDYKILKNNGMDFLDSGKVEKYLDNVIEEMTDVEIQLHFLKLDLIMNYVGEQEFEKKKNEQYIIKMNKIRRRLQKLKGEKEDGIADD